MTDVLRFVVGLAADVVRGHAGLVSENALLRQQLIVAQRRIAGRVRWAPWQRFTMGLVIGDPSPSSPVELRRTRLPERVRSNDP